MAPPLLPHRFYAAEAEIQSPTRAAEEALAAGQCQASSSVTKAQLLRFHFLHSKMRKYTLFLGNQWQMNVWTEDQAEQIVWFAFVHMAVTGN